MDFAGIEPFVRHIEKLNEYSEISVLRVSYDHVFLYLTKGEAEIGIGEEKYAMQKNSLLFVGSGIPYQITEWKAAEAIWMHFDFKPHQRVESPTYIRPVQAAAFDPSGIIEKNGVSEIGLPEVFYLEKVHELEYFLQAVWLEEKQQEKYFDMIGSSFVRVVLALAGRILEEKQLENAAVQKDIVGSIIEYIYENIDKNITYQLVGKTFGFHPKYINLLFESETGYSIHKYVRMRRISKAIEYLQTTELPVCEIAERLGFSESKYFAKVFKGIVGKTPEEYRRILASARD